MTKEPISTKGCRVTAQISLPGRFLVYMPYASKVGVSRKIESREQRAKLREMVTKLLPKDAGGVIVRTVAEGVTEEHFRREIDSLLALWQQDQPEEDLRPPGAGAAAAGDQPHPRHHPRPLQRQGGRAARRLEGALQRDRAVPAADRPRAHEPGAPLRRGHARCSTSSTSSPRSATCSRRGWSCRPAAR